MSVLKLILVGVAFTMYVAMLTVAAMLGVCDPDEFQTRWTERDLTNAS